MVKDNDGEQTEPMLNTLVTSVGFIGVLGLGILVGLVGVLLKNSVPNDIVGVIIVFYLATLFGICFSLIRLMSKLIGANVGKKPTKLECHKHRNLLNRRLRNLTNIINL